MPHVRSASARIMRRALAVQNGYCVHLPIRLPLGGLVPPTYLPPPGLERATADLVLDYLLLRDPPVVKPSLEEEEADIATVSENLSCRMQASESLVDVGIGVQASESLVDVDIGVQASESLVDVGVGTVDVADFHCEVGCQTDSVVGMEGGASGVLLGKVTVAAEGELEAPSSAESSPNVRSDSDSRALSGASQGCLNRPVTLNEVSKESRQRTRGRDRDKVKGTSTCSQATIADVKAWIDAVASINELNAIQYLKNGMDLFDKLVTERGFPTKKAQKDYARKLYEMLQNVQATLEDLLGFFEVHRFLTGQMNRAEMAMFLEVSKCSDYRIIFFGRPRSFDKLG
ncbi:unnamed protein product [Prorocentrum cordatum]|uniref:Uncharacterized protein n=1 Tax=Prorocentrum cordatum TaxID=2364126 RepID=A0ABN9Q8K2_9DINO|nr:unnamed protein product [Polarella glacialis]